MLVEGYKGRRKVEELSGRPGSDLGKLYLAGPCIINRVMYTLGQIYRYYLTLIYLFDFTNIECGLNLSTQSHELGPYKQQVA